MPVSELNLLSADIQSYIVAPMAAFGLGGFLFDVEGETTATLIADITDHYSEDNLALNDHIARKPRSLVLKGYVGELIVVPNSNTNDSILQQVRQKLTIIADFLPQITAATAQVEAATEKGDNLQNLPLADAANIYGLVKNILGTITSDTPRQQQAFMFFKACWQQGILMSIQTPWEFLTNMAIENVTAIQPEGSKYISDFSIRYKQLRFAQTTSAAYNAAGPNTSSSSDNVLGYAGNYPPIVPVQKNILDGAAAVQAPDPVTIGNVPGLSLPTNQLPGGQSQIMNAEDLYKNNNVRGIYIPAPPPASAF